MCGAEAGPVGTTVWRACVRRMCVCGVGESVHPHTARLHLCFTRSPSQGSCVRPCIPSRRPALSMLQTVCAAAWPSADLGCPWHVPHRVATGQGTQEGLCWRGRLQAQASVVGTGGQDSPEAPGRPFQAQSGGGARRAGGGGAKSAHRAKPPTQLGDQHEGGPRRLLDGSTLEGPAGHWGVTRASHTAGSQGAVRRCRQAHSAELSEPRDSSCAAQT